MATRQILAEETVSVSEIRKHPIGYFTDHPVAVLDKNQLIGYMIGKEHFESMVDLIRQTQALENYSATIRPQEDYSATIRPSATQPKTIAASSNAIEITKSGEPLDYLTSIQQKTLDSLLAQTNSVTRVEDPYSESNVAYIVIDINPCSPIIREVPKGTENSFSTLADAKEAARQKIQSSINEAQKSLTELRQIGIDNITYISL